ncbi:MAG TPA: proline/glycine betaine ABC transporter permease, partial [Modicisalibacter sp.]|nr:proline/glycine betaine ABC transporter permease [Modicisalibacter sp.]
MAIDIPRIPLGDWIEGGLDYLTSNYSMVTRGISEVTQAGINILNDSLMWLPEWALMAIIALLCWRIAGIRLGIGAVLGLALIWNLGLWNPMIE